MRRGRGVGGLLVLLGARRRFVFCRITGVHPLGDALRVRALEADGRGYNYAISLVNLDRFKEAKSLLRRQIPVARRVHGESNDLTIRMRLHYARTLYEDPTATLDDLREAVTALEEIERTMRRVFGGAHPVATAIGVHLGKSRATLRERLGI